jgi:hypothetical protein
MSFNFYPFKEGDRLTPDVLNNLVESIMDGSIFSTSASSLVASTMATMGARVTSVEARLVVVENEQAKSGIREQFVTTLHQGTLTLSKTPLLDSEMVSINGMNLSKSGIPSGFVGDYSISGRVITFNTELANQIPADAVLVVVYDYVI